MVFRRWRKEQPEATDKENDKESTSGSEIASSGEKPIQAKKTTPLLRLLYGTTPDPIVQNTETYPYLHANAFDRLFFRWVYPIIKKGYLRRLEQEDLYQLDDVLSCDNMTRRFEENLKKRAEQYAEKHPGQKYTKYTVIRALNDTFFKEFWTGGVAKVLTDASQVTMSLPVRKLVKHIQEKDELPGGSSSHAGLGKATGYAVCIAAMLIISSLLISKFFHHSMLTGGRVKAVLTNTIYRKSFRLSAREKLRYPNGKVNSMVMADLSRVDLAVGTFHFIWVFPITFSIGLIILVINLRGPAMIGLGLILVFLCLLLYMAQKIKQLRRSSIKFIDKRVGAINEIINSLKMIKFYSWEKPYYAIVSKFREEEKLIILRQQLLKAAQNSGVSSITILASMLTFLCMVSINSGFQSYNIFSSITLFNSLRFPMNLLPMSIGFLTDALLAMDRVADFLQAEEEVEEITRAPKEDSPNAIEIVNGNFQWDVEELELEQKSKKGKTEVVKPAIDKDEKDLSFPGLNHINLTVKENEFIIITGSIGTGKTSLLNAINGTMKKISGDSRIYGSLTFCSYPWVQNTTIRENILFGSEYDSVKYNNVIKSCALDVDFQMFPEHDFTEVGERGITLSGGQKARINLARAVYADRDIILLDDVLSAVDARVGKHIMNECICGLLKGKTRILATHQLSLIGFADRIIFLDGSGSIETDTVDALIARNNLFKTLMDFSKEDDDEEDEEGDGNLSDEDAELEIQKSQISKIKSIKEESHKKLSGNITEGRSEKSISFGIYIDYFALGAGKLGKLVFPVFFLIALCCGFLQLFQSVWLSYWLSEEFNISEGAYKGLYVMFCFLATFSFFALFGFLAYVNNRAGLQLFKLSTQRLLKAPMWFMDVTPIGRILNRFTKDVDVLDTDLMEQLRLFCNSTILVISTLILCACYIPWFLLCIPVIFFIYYHLFVFYKTSALDIKRIESVNRSFVFSHFNESLSGMKVIKSFGSTTRFLNRFDLLIDDMNRAYFLTFANQRWLSIRLDCIAACVSFFVSMLCAGGVFNVTSSSSGLLVSYIIQVSSLTSLLLRSMTQLENDMNSVERLFEYATSLPQEGPFETSRDVNLAEDWPQRGEISFKNVELSYRKGLPLVLKNVSFNVKGGEKIGICGRTGAGKSTIMNALFRVSELEGGEIIVDDVDISKIGLDDLRSRLSIIPQDPVLFHGTIRQNLDPFGLTPDSELWDALRRSWLVDEAASGTGKYTPEDINLKTLHKFHLDQRVEDDGANFSLGERQLLALTRALVRNSRILIMDEATSSVDYETDAKIQSTIAKEFAQCTILCIAHRLKTILSYDRILVLDKGQVIEFDTPWNLFNANGIFTEMCQRSKITAVDFEKANP